MATYKTGWMKKLIDGVATKVFAISHVKSVFYDYANSKTLQTKLDEMDTSISGKAASSHSHTSATTSAAGFMSSSDKTKLNGIATGATKTTVDSAMSSTSTNPVQNKVLYTELEGKSDTDHTHSSLSMTAGTLGSRTVSIGATSSFYFIASSDNNLTLGTSSNRWKQLYAGTTTIATSDRNCKKDIKNLLDDERFILFFKKLVPVSFLFTDGTSGRTHVGFIAQDVEDAMLEVGLTDLDFAGLCKDVKMKYTGNDDENGNPIFEKDLDENGNDQYVYALRYSEFIAINTMMIQKLDNRVQDLEENMAKVFEHLNLE